jgi:Tfp pilus assembly protein PilF
MGETYPETEITYMYIGMVYNKQEDFKNAWLYYLKSLEI